MTCRVNRLQRRTRIRRRGFTLVELSVSVTISAVVLSLITIVVIRVLSFESRTRNHVQLVLSQARLSDQFRDDVHTATQATIIDGEGTQTSRLKLLLGKTGEIEYAHIDGSLERLKRHDGRIASRQRYRLQKDAAVGWLRREIGSVELIRVNVRPPGGRIEYSIVAEIGRYPGDLTVPTMRTDSAN